MLAINEKEKLEINQKMTFRDEFKQMAKIMPRSLAYGFLGSLAAIALMIAPSAPLPFIPVIMVGLYGMAYVGSTIGISLGMALTGDFKEIPTAPGFVAKGLAVLFGTTVMMAKNDIGNLWKKLTAPKPAADPREVRETLQTIADPDHLLGPGVRSIEPAFQTSANKPVKQEVGSQISIDTPKPPARSL